MFLGLVLSGNAYAKCTQGNCTNGQGTATYSNGGKYVGEWKDGKRNGLGTAIFANGDKYVGEFKDEKRNGLGTFTFANGDKYVGEWKDGSQNGQGTLIYADGSNYIGEWKDGEQNSLGTFTWANGGKYVGEFKDGKRNGQGTYSYENGGRYVGTYKDDKKNGLGTFIFADGNKYVGEFKDEKRNGLGTFTFANGDKYVGEYKDGKLINKKEIPKKDNEKTIENLKHILTIFKLVSVYDYEISLEKAKTDRATSERLQIYFTGLSDGMAWTDDLHKRENKKRIYCLGDKTADVSIIMTIVNNHIKNKNYTDDQKKLFPLGLIVADAMKTEFPCNK